MIKFDNYMDLKVAVVQFDIKWEDTEGNIKYLTNCLKDLSSDTDLVVLPEMFHCGFSMSTQNTAQKERGQVLQWMQSVAQLHDVTIMGSVVVDKGNGVVNRLYVVDGEKVSWYDKRHLFTMGGEHLHYKKGQNRLIVNVKGWKICPLICYDLRFPVWSRNKGEDEYHLLIYVANWPESRIGVWDILLKARAIENQSYVIGVNRIGNDKSLTYNGHSQVIDAKGSIQLDMGDNNAIAYVVLKKIELMQFRAKFPVLNDGDLFEIKGGR